MRIKRLESVGGVIWGELHLVVRGLRWSSEQCQQSYFLLEVVPVTTEAKLSLDIKNPIPTGKLL